MDFHAKTVQWAISEGKYQYSSIMVHFMLTLRVRIISNVNTIVGLKQVLGPFVKNANVTIMQKHVIQRLENVSAYSVLEVNALNVIQVKKGVQNVLVTNAAPLIQIQGKNLG